MSGDRDLWRRDEPDSPCRRICVIHEESGLCVGCLRTADEIAAWPAMSAQDRREVMAGLPARAAQLRRRRGGRKGRGQGADSQASAVPGQSGRK